MNKIYHIAHREFTQRIIKKSFWIMTLLGPVIMSLLMIVPAWLSLDLVNDTNLVVVTSSNNGLYKQLKETSTVTYVYNDNYNIPADSTLSWFNAKAELRELNGQFSYLTNNYDPDLELLLEQSVALYKYSSINIEESFKLNKRYIRDTNQGKYIKELLAYVMGISAYFFIFMYGVQIMKGVIEEKTNRIIEVMLCTVKPFEMMMGKICGISLLGFFQFTFWLISLFIVQWLISQGLGLDRAVDVDFNQLTATLPEMQILNDAQVYLDTISTMNWRVIIVSYLWFFIFGFLLFAALFAVIGSASDADTDTQQFIFPITVPLLGTMVLAQQIVANPFGKLATILSYIPFCSPVAMCMRLPFENGSTSLIFDVIFSGLILFFTFLFTVWVAARIYKVGILTYGSKVTYVDLIKWFFEKD